MESVANILDADTHVQLDRAVLKTCEDLIEPSKLRTLVVVFLLVIVVHKSKGTSIQHLGAPTTQGNCSKWRSY